MQFLVRLASPFALFRVLPVLTYHLQLRTETCLTRGGASADGSRCAESASRRESPQCANPLRRARARRIRGQTPAPECALQCSSCRTDRAQWLRSKAKLAAPVTAC